MLLLPDSRLDERRTAASTGGLVSLFDSLAADLEPLLGREPSIPREKALLSRAGGRCERDGTTLAFDPWSPDRHRCSACGTEYTGEIHHRAWVWPYQLWLAERAVQGALLAHLRGDARHATFAREILCAYAERYHTYPNVDNVLGPTRLFFSTYLESIWLLQIVIAADLLRAAGDVTSAALAGERIIAPSAAIIAEYDEGMSNRQVWNNAALLASAAFLGEDAAFDARIDEPSGLRAHLSEALLSDGTWYEGENYHQFALRGLWYGVTIAETRGRRFEDHLIDRFHRAFAAPYVTALPDFTMPSRKDSQYAVSLRQWRMVELAELGFARTRDPALAAALARSYETGHERRDTGRARSTADVERNGPSGLLTRADLGWRALLHAVDALPALDAVAPKSALLEGQGYAVFRRAPNAYVGFEFGQSGGGHGHPDRLNLTLYQGSTRWLDDLGTGSYVDPSLHWYRSTLAHNAPLVNGTSQPLQDGELIAYDERGDFGWIVAAFHIAKHGVRIERTIVVGPDYLIDDLHWTADRIVRVELPWHLATSREAGRDAVLDGGMTPDDGFPFVETATEETFGPVSLNLRLWHGDLTAHLFSDTLATLYRAHGPGQPAAQRRPFYVVRAHAKDGRLGAAITWNGDVTSGIHARTSEMLTMRVRDRDDVHRRDAKGWHVQRSAPGGPRLITLAGFRERRASPRAHNAPLRSALPLRPSSIPDGWWSDSTARDPDGRVILELGESHYRRSEESWSAAGRPSATVVLAVDQQRLVVLADIRAGEPHFAAADARNPLDNEHPDTMAAGVQLYLRTETASAAWMLVPEPRVDRVRTRYIRKDGELGEPSATWRRSSTGYEMRIELPLPLENAFDLDLIINETTLTRQRRRGQLVLSGANGEFVYLRGDRHDPERYLRFEVTR